MAQIIMASNIVKPSSPTPVTSKIHKLSYLDQIAPPIYIPLIFFYQNVEFMQQELISRRLKQSLSEILTVFYPFAGTVHQNSFVDCNDRGAEFVEARVHARLSQFLQNPKMEELIMQLLPTDTSSYEESGVQLSVKTSFFDCGGISVGVCFPHKIADLSSFATFMNSWAATCRGEASRIVRPYFDVARHFPPRDLPPASGYTLGLTDDEIVTKRLVFDKRRLEKLLEELSSDGVMDPSRDEAVSVFIWRSFIEAYKARRETASSSFTASHSVNLRPRAVPPLPDHTIGNCFTSASAVVTSSEDDDVTRGVLVSKLRAAVRGVEEISYMNNKILIKDDDENIRSSMGGLFKSENCYLSSWWRFPVNEVDFGWGNPVWVCTGTMPFLNLVLFMDTPSGDDIEAWINVPDEQFFQVFQANYDKLLSSLN